MWQKCPVCNGNGYTPSELTLASNPCPTCQGSRIISELTGLPPANAPIKQPMQSLPQIEITNQEIDDAGEKHITRNSIYLSTKAEEKQCFVAFIEGAKWYREELKNKSK